MMERLRFYIWQFWEKCYMKKHILRVVSTNTGIKLFNPVPFRLPSVTKGKGDIITINPEALFIGPDYLKNEYTLLDLSIANSPHRSFIQGLLEGKDMTHSEYMNRLVDGCLDARPITLRPRSTAGFEKKCKERCESVKKGEYESVQIFSYNDKYYIIDGKHRAAMCSVLGVPVRCRVIDANLSCGLTFHIYNIMKDKPEFSRQTSFFQLNGVFA